MNIILYTNNSEKNRIGKDLTQIASLTGSLKDGTSLINPVITISNATSLTDLKKVNYLYIADFGRYYFINDIASIRTGIWSLSCHCDVLESFKTEILTQQAVIARQEYKWNLYLNDGMFKTYSNPILVYKKFPNAMNNPTYILCTTGGYYQSSE